MSERIRGKLGDAMVEAALTALAPTSWGPAHSWYGNYGLKQPASDWRIDMRRALEAAFNVLLEEPTP